jgi:uncharacterized protein YdeI (YjbR/CyaY-like superfamily)
VTSSAHPPDGRPILLFETIAAWEEWLDGNHAATDGVWLRLAKKGAPLRSISYAEALEGALCYGWIDGQKRAYDEDSWLQKFTRRGRRSIWSRINRDKAEALLASGRMRTAGEAAVEAARADGRWDAAYDPASRASVPADLAAELERSPAAREFFETLSGANRYAILFRLQTAAKPATRAKRLREYVAMLERGETLH